jgi:hypothetical protein
VTGCPRLPKNNAVTDAEDPRDTDRRQPFELVLADRFDPVPPEHRAARATATPRRQSPVHQLQHASSRSPYTRRRWHRP